MYLTPDELKGLMEQLKSCFSKLSLLMDCYTTFAARTSKYKNPVHDVGVTQVYGLDAPHEIGLPFVKEHDLTPDYLIEQLTGWEKGIFKCLFAGRFAKKSIDCTNLQHNKKADQSNLFHQKPTDCL